MADLTVIDDKVAWEARVDRLWAARPTRWRDAWHELTRNKLALGGSVIVQATAPGSSPVSALASTRARSSQRAYAEPSALFCTAWAAWATVMSCQPLTLRSTW